MILQTLAAYYDRLLEEGSIPPPGLQEKELHWAVEIEPDGTFVALTRTGEGKRGRKATVPAEVKKSVNIAANLLWDNPEYVFGVARAGATEKQAAKAPLRHADFVKRLRGLDAETRADPGVAAVIEFMRKGDFAAAKASEAWTAMAENGGNVSFRLSGDKKFVCERPVVRKAATAVATTQDGDDATNLPWCLVTGRRAVAARLHPSIKGVRGGQTSGTNIVSFNLDAFKSHGWDKGQNAPVGKAAANAYVAALNHLLARDNDTHHSREGDTTFVFWAARKTVMEDRFAHLCDGETLKEIEKNGRSVANVFDSIRKGLLVFDDDDTPFYVLGLAPNAARLAVRFWYQGTVADVAGRFRRHFDDLEIADPYGNIKNLGLWRLLGAASRGGDVKNMQDNLRGVLAAEVTAAILKGTPYPHTLLARTIERCRAEQSVWPIRAALIKAVLNRRIRQFSPKEKEITVSLDPDYDNPGYLLGRLFAAFEDIQRGAQKAKINTTIRDRYFAAAAASPRSVFIQLDKLKNAHLKKLRRVNPGHAVNAEKLVGAITDKIAARTAFPDALSLDDQGRFIIGYHHQKQNFFKKPNPAKET
mgnify:CR=1 FL=1